jgi:phosphoribosyl-AMP cyclohydrolase
MTMLKIHFDDKGLVPVIAQDSVTKEVLMLAYANQEAVELTQSTGYAHYYSRSRNKLWKKGEESGHMQKVHDVLVDCDEDALIYLVTQTTAACHTGFRSCFYRRLDGTEMGERLFNPDDVYSKSK